MSCLFICACQQFDEHSWSRMFVFSISNFIASWFLFAYFVHVGCCCFRLTVYPLFSDTDVVGLLLTSSLFLFVWLMFIVYVCRFFELYLILIVVSVFCSRCLLLLSFNCLFSFLWYWCSWFTCNKFVIFVCVAFVYYLNVKRWYNVSIFVTIYYSFTFNFQTLKSK